MKPPGSRSNGIGLIRIFGAATLRSQITLVVAVGVLLLSLLSALVMSWQSSHEIRERRLVQGQKLVENLARQARPALLAGSGASISDAAATTLAFPDVTTLYLVSADGKRLTIPGVAAADADRDASDVFPVQRLDGSAFGALLPVPGKADDRVWRFVAPVTSDASEGKAPVVLGHAVVVMSRQSLENAIARLFGTNIAIAVCIALPVLLLVRRSTRAVTQPLQHLAEAMGRAGRGDIDVRAERSGSRDIVDMAEAFNGMMEALAEREEALRRAREDALRLARLKSEFVATMSHELRTPLNGMVGTLDLMRASKLPPMARRYVDLAWDSSQYLLELINNILDFSSLEAGDLELLATDFDVALLCEQTIDLFAPQVSIKGLDIAYSIAADVPRQLKGDSRRVRQVLLNLVGNAVKFTEHGEVAVTISRVPDSTLADRGKYRFSVRDTGIGIPPAVITGIFDSFTQADASTTRRRMVPALAWRSASNWWC